MLTDAQVAAVAKYMQTVSLTPGQKERLVRCYWQATPPERVLITRAYAALFATDEAFVQRLIAFRDLRHVHSVEEDEEDEEGEKGNDKENEEGQGNSSSGNYASGGIGADAAADDDDGDEVNRHQHDHHHSNVNSASGGRRAVARGAKKPSAKPKRTSGGSHKGPGASSSSSSSVTSQKHKLALIQGRAQDQTPKLVGPGPFTLSFGLVATEAERAAVVALYASQFEQPSLSEIQEMVELPQCNSTRTRCRLLGSCSWYVRCHDTGDMVCAVTVTVHHQAGLFFFEMPLFATAPGYKRCGLGRLLHAALAALCVREGAEFLLISADQQAVEFWEHMGYRAMTRSEASRVAFVYENACYEFEGTRRMVAYCARPRDSRGERATIYGLRAADVLQKMPRFQISGSTHLPVP